MGGEESRLINEDGTKAKQSQTRRMGSGHERQITQVSVIRQKTREGEKTFPQRLLTKQEKA